MVKRGHSTRKHRYNKKSKRGGYNGNLNNETRMNSAIASPRRNINDVRARNTQPTETYAPPPPPPLVRQTATQQDDRERQQSTFGNIATNLTNAFNSVSDMLASPKTKGQTGGKRYRKKHNSKKRTSHRRSTKKHNLRRHGKRANRKTHRNHKR
jgi:hypothetical protein